MDQQRRRGRPRIDEKQIMVGTKPVPYSEYIAEHVGDRLEKWMHEQRLRIKRIGCPGEQHKDEDDLNTYWRKKRLGDSLLNKTETKVEVRK